MAAGTVGVAMALMAVTAAPAFAAQTWEIQTSVDPQGSTATELTGMACASASSCVAVGYWVDAQSTEFTLVERWNGTKWSVQTSPNPSGDGALLHGVSCSSATACMAVGWYHKGAKVLTLVERWNGSKWTVVSSPNTAKAANFLSGVSCVSANSCEAVGASGVSVVSPTRTLAEKWNGSKWTVVKSPTPQGVDNSELTAVSCSSSKACTAAGVTITNRTVETAIAERWNGSKWKLQQVATPNGAVSFGFQGVSCPSATACTATGMYVDQASVGLTLAERWNGSSWKIQKTPNPTGAEISALGGVSCASVSTCTSVGLARDTRGEFPIAEQWNGSSWKLQAVPSPGGATPQLVAVACVSAQVCEADGFYPGSMGIRSTLIEGSS